MNNDLTAREVELLYTAALGQLRAGGYAPSPEDIQRVTALRALRRTYINGAGIVRCEARNEEGMRCWMGEGHGHPEHMFLDNEP